MSEIVVVGSVNMDLTSRLPRWPDVGETLTANRTEIGLGGKGANQAVAAARLGAHVSLIGAVGADAFGQQVTQALTEANVQMSIETRTQAATGMAFIDIVPGGDNMIRLSPGANATLTATELLRHAPLISRAKVVLLQNEIPLAASLQAARIARSHGATVIMDPAPAPQPMWDSKTRAQFDLITPNAQEAALMTGHAPHGLPDAERTAAALAQDHPGGAVVTMGALGVAWHAQGAGGSLAAPRVETVDTVAAGDCFNGALAVFLAQGCNVPQAVSFAVDAAALATTRRGASASAPALSDLLVFRSEEGPPPRRLH